MKRLWVSLARTFAPERRRHALALLAVLVTAFAIRARYIELSLPYCRHVDESTWAKIALRILRTGDPNPHRFRKPSLPVYVMTAGFSVGLVHARWTGQARHAEDLGTTPNPYYRVPSAALPPKLLFALATVLALGFAGYCAAALGGRSALLWLTPIVASVSSSYLRLSWSYMTVDVLGALFIWGTLAYLVRARRLNLSLTSGPGSLRRLVALGALAGCAVGSKYNLFPILVPCVLWFVLIERAHWFSRSVLVGVVSLVTFFVTTPYALVTPSEFIADVLFEVRHYSTGHGATAEARGLPMLWRYLQHFRENFGLLPLLVALAGMACCFRRDARLSLLVFSFPVVFVAYMSMQRVFFERNVLALHLHVALAIAVALLDAPSWIAAVVRARWPELPLSRVKAFGFGAVLAVVLLGIPWPRVALAYSGEVDARNRVNAWLRRKVNRKQWVIVDPELKMDPRPLKKRAQVEEADPVTDAARLRELSRHERHLYVVTKPERQAAYAAVVGDLGVKAHFAPAGRPKDLDDVSRGVVILER